MEKINFQNGVTPVNADTFNTFQNNIEAGINEVTNTTRTNIPTIGNIINSGKLVILNITLTEKKDNVENNKATVLATLDIKWRPTVNLIVNPVVAKDEKYTIIPNSYVILRNTGVLEFYQASGATKNVKQILGQISYYIS